MNECELGHFVGNNPLLDHFAEPGSWEGIRRNGLLSTSALLDLYAVRGDEGVRLESARRETTRRLPSPSLPAAFVRDQHAMNETTLACALTAGITPSQWYEFLNRKVFFWAELRRLYGMSRAYRDRGGEVLVLDTRYLLAAHRSRVRLSHMNSGATRSRHHTRSYQTFCRIEDYPYASRRRKVAEVCIESGVPDVLPFVRCVRRLHGSTWGETIYSSGGSD